MKNIGGIGSAVASVLPQPRYLVRRYLVKVTNQN